MIILQNIYLCFDKIFKPAKSNIRAMKNDHAKKIFLPAN